MVVLYIHSVGGTCVATAPHVSPCCPKYFNLESGVATYILWISNWVSCLGPPYVGICDQTYVLKGADLLAVECVTQHVLDEGHSFGPMTNIMDIIHIEKKGRMLDTLEKYYIYRETQNGNQINDKLTFRKTPFSKACVL